jgi:hypothetical protein
VLAPDEHRAKVAERAAVDGGFELLPRGEGLELVALAGLKVREGVFTVDSDGRKSLLVPGDLIFNVPDGGFMLRLMGSSGGPKVTPLARFMLVKDKPALAASLRETAKLPGLARIVVCHGKNIDRDPARVLGQVADRLEGKK